MKQITKEIKDYCKSKSKTFQQGDDVSGLMDWFVNQIETHDYQPEGTDWSGVEPGPIDPVCELKHKYIITVIKISKADSGLALDKENK